jgi:hypothetical protein|eukprot:SAG25_NODE_474_length_7638_cov_5.842962_1_plen_94_part_00
MPLPDPGWVAQVRASMLSSGLLTQPVIDSWAPAIAWRSSGLIGRLANPPAGNVPIGASFGSDKVAVGGNDGGRVGRFRVAGSAMYGRFSIGIW